MSNKIHPVLYMLYKNLKLFLLVVFIILTGLYEFFSAFSYKIYETSLANSE